MFEVVFQSSRIVGKFSEIIWVEFSTIPPSTSPSLVISSSGRFFPFKFSAFPFWKFVIVVSSEKLSSVMFSGLGISTS